MTALTVDLQDLSCHVGVKQSHMLHATSVGDTIISSVHLELEAASHCEWFSCGIYLRSACKESDKEYTRKLLYYLGADMDFEQALPSLQPPRQKKGKKYFGKTAEENRNQLCGN